MKNIKKYVWNILISIDQLANTILAGDPDETISSRCGKWAKLNTSGWRKFIAIPLSKFLSLFEKDHCEKSIEEDEGKDAVIKKIGGPK